MEITKEYILDQTEKYSDILPQTALRAAKEFKKELIPELIRRIDYAVDRGEDLADDYVGHIYAIFLLAEFRAPEAFVPMLRMLYLDQDTLDYLLDDYLLEGFPSCLAILSQGSCNELLEIAENQDLEEYARWSALEALELQYSHALVDRLTLEKEFERMLRSAIAYFVAIEDRMRYLEELFGTKQDEWFESLCYKKH